MHPIDEGRKHGDSRSGRASRVVGMSCLLVVLVASSVIGITPWLVVPLVVLVAAAIG